MATKKYTLTGEQVEALFKLLYSLNLSVLKRTGEIIVARERVDIETGKIIHDLFYDKKFAEDK